ncbi:MAG: hypothetical protein IAE93_00410 [Ignavibacteria bacterium]|nr:hypothetical protein [Ignavibacteria bacterium]
MKSTEVAKKLYEIYEAIDGENTMVFLRETILGNFEHSVVFENQRYEITRKINRLYYGLQRYVKDPAYHEIIEGFGFPDWINEEFITELIVMMNNIRQPSDIWTNTNRFQKLGGLYYFLRDINFTRQTLNKLLVADKTAVISIDERTFLYEIDDNKHGQNIVDVANVLTLINDIYKRICKIERIEICEDLRIEFVESGSSILISLIGLIVPANIMMTIVKKYDDIRTSRFERGIKNFKETVELRDYIITSIATNKLTPEEAESAWIELSTKLLKIHGIEMNENYDVSEIIAEGKAGKLLLESNNPEKEN